jgi:hypothetical protein
MKRFRAYIRRGLPAAHQGFSLDDDDTHRASLISLRADMISLYRLSRNIEY